MIESTLKKIGMKEKEIQIFLAIFRFGEASPSMLARKTKIPRTTVFDILIKLANKGLVQRYEKHGRNYFGCDDETALLKYIKKQQKRWVKNQAVVEKILPLMHNIRAPYSPAPTIKFYEGAAEVSTIYNDILETGEDILLLRSIYDHVDEDLGAILEDYIPKQIKKGIHVKALTPWIESSVEHYVEQDKKRLIDRRVYEKSEFSLPAQIIIYGGKAAIITLKNQIFGTVLEHEDVVQTLKIIFELLWQRAEKDHKKFLKAVEIYKKKNKKK